MPERAFNHSGICVVPEFDGGSLYVAGATSACGIHFASHFS
jgi:hypothetical protein